MENFKQIKEEILRRAKSASACAGQYKRALEAQSLEELAQVIKDNFDWFVYDRVLDTKIIGEYREEFASVGIYANESCNDGYVVIDSEVENISGNAIAILHGNATVNRVCGNATVNRVYDNATVNEVYDNATVNEVYCNATVNEVCGNATVNRVCGNATVNRVCGNATVNEVYDNATVNMVYDNAYISVYSYIECKISGNAIMRVRSENKIYTNTKVVKPQ